MNPSGDGFSAESRFVVTGAGGAIGTALTPVLRRHAPVVVASSRPGSDLHLDLRDASRFDFSLIRAGDVVIHLAAVSSPDACAADPATARAINLDGTVHFVRGAVARGARVMVFSSDVVLGERSDPVDESAALAPVGVYASLKADLETQVSSLEQVRVVRLSYVVSPNDRFLRYLAGCAKRSEFAEVFDPFDRAAILLDDVVDALTALAVRWPALPGSVVHCGGDRLVSRAQMATAAERGSGGRLRWQVRTPGADFFRERPRVINFVSPAVAGLLGRAPADVAAAIESYFENTSEVD